MCSTCGCGNTDHVHIKTPDGKTITHVHLHHEHNHEHHTHHHVHDHHDHNHSHGSGHEHHHHHDLIQLEQDILKENNLLAERNRGYFLAKNIFCVNLVSSPGSGKTSLLERTLKDLKNKIRFYVIEGDQQTVNDAQRIQALDVPALQINTGKACHLDSEMIHKAIMELNPEPNSILFIENVGNLVCPASFDLGENERVVIMSTTEGTDKPLKYPDMFESSSVCVINKIDLLPYLDFDIEKAKEYALRINPRLKFFEVSATQGDGMDQWYQWLENQITQQK